MHRGFGARALIGALALTSTFWIGAANAAGGYKVLYNFSGGATDGAIPIGALIRGPDASLYGTTFLGGPAGEGTVFKLAPDRSLTILHTFNAAPSDGAEPLADLVLDGSGNLYGTTQIGGSTDMGTVFRVAQNGTESVIHSFTGNPDGAYFVYAGLTKAPDGNFYGATVTGGSSDLGAIFKLTLPSTVTILHSFKADGTEGAGPEGTLIADESGNLYGTTNWFGPSGHGTVFRLAPDGTLDVLCAFTGGGDGGEPASPLVMDKRGNLYGTTEYGGEHDSGVVFKLAPNGTESVLHSFTGGSDGARPISGLIMDKAGNLYGTARFGGRTNADCADGCGTVFKVAPDGTETTLHKFSGADGRKPWARLVSDGKKKFKHVYGVTGSGGTFDLGTIFEIKLKK